MFDSLWSKGVRVLAPVWRECYLRNTEWVRGNEQKESITVWPVSPRVSRCFMNASYQSFQAVNQSLLPISVQSCPTRYALLNNATPCGMLASNRVTVQTLLTLNSAQTTLWFATMFTKKLYNDSEPWKSLSYRVELIFESIIFSFWFSCELIPQYSFW